MRLHVPGCAPVPPFLAGLVEDVRMAVELLLTRVFDGLRWLLRVFTLTPTQQSARVPHARRARRSSSGAGGGGGTPSSGVPARAHGHSKSMESELVCRVGECAFWLGTVAPPQQQWLRAGHGCACAWQCVQHSFCDHIKSDYADAPLRTQSVARRARSMPPMQRSIPCGGRTATRRAGVRRSRSRRSSLQQPRSSSLQVRAWLINTAC